MDEDVVHSGARRSVRRTVALSALTTVVGAGIAAVLITNAYAGDDPHEAPVAAAVQRYSAPGGYTLKKPKPLRFQAFAAVEDTPSASPSSGAAAPVEVGPVAPAGEAQAYAAAQVSARGWSKQDFGCLVRLWARESGWNAHAASASGAYGIPQAFPGSKMASAGGDWRNDHRVQIRWGLGYIAGRYGTPCGAWAHSVATGSY